MTRYHISPRTGNPAVCRAQGKCPFGDLDRDHFNTPGDARQAYELRMKQGELPSFAPGHIRVAALPPGMKQSEASFAVPKGMYVLGDPKFTAGRDEVAWGEWNEAAKNSNDPAVGATYNGYPVLAFRTAGPGTYYNNLGQAFTSESGFMGLVPAVLAKKMGLDDMEAFDDGHLLHLPETTVVSLEGESYAFGDRTFMRATPEPFED